MTHLSARSRRAAPRALAKILAGSWRPNPLPLAIEAHLLDALLPALIGSGAGALAWRRLRHSDLAHHPAALALQQLHLKQALDAQLEARKLTQCFEALRGAGIQGLLIKGWATARTYPEPGLRAVGDIDLLIDPRDKPAVEAALGIRVDDETNAVWDIKSDVPALYGVSAAVLEARQQHVMLGQIRIATLGAEDHLRILCLHFLKHGAWRPLWLCDIAAALESRPADFDWNICLGPNSRSADHIACTLGVAHQLLGANIANTPIAARPPKWMVRAVLREWERPETKQHQASPFLLQTLRTRHEIGLEMRRRWPNPFQTALAWQLSLNSPPLPAQIASFLAGSFQFLKRTAKLKRE